MPQLQLQEGWSMTDARPLLRELLGGPVVAYHPRLAHFVGGVKAAVMLSQLYYLSGQLSDPDAPFAASVDALEASTGLSVKEQASARDELLSRRLIHVDRKGMPRRYLYRVDLAALVALIAGQLPLPGLPESPKGRLQSRQKGDTGVAQPASHESPNGPLKERGTKKGEGRGKGAAPSRPPPVAILISASQRTPPKAIWPQIVQRVGADPAALDRWRKVVEEWCAHGYNRSNVGGMLDVFEKGWTRPNGSKPGSSAAHDPAADVARFNARRPAAAAAHTKEPA
jgi:hypothetical protein